MDCGQGCKSAWESKASRQHLGDQEITWDFPPFKEVHALACTPLWETQRPRREAIPDSDISSQGKHPSVTRAQPTGHGNNFLPGQREASTRAEEPRRVT